MSLLSPCLSFPIHECLSSCHSALCRCQVQTHQFSNARHWLGSSGLKIFKFIFQMCLRRTASFPLVMFVSCYIHAQPISTKWSSIKATLVHTHCYKMPICLKYDNGVRQSAVATSLLYSLSFLPTYALIYIIKILSQAVTL